MKKKCRRVFFFYCNFQTISHPLLFFHSPGCSRGDDSAESGGGGAGSSPRSEEGGVPLGVRGHTSSASVKSESPASPIPHGLHTPAHQVFGKSVLVVVWLINIACENSWKGVSGHHFVFQSFNTVHFEKFQGIKHSVSQAKMKTTINWSVNCKW